MQVYLKNTYSLIHANIRSVYTLPPNWYLLIENDLSIGISLRCVTESRRSHKLVRAMVKVKSPVTPSPYEKVFVHLIQGNSLSFFARSPTDTLIISISVTTNKRCIVVQSIECSFSLYKQCNNSVTVHIIIEEQYTQIMEWLSLIMSVCVLFNFLIHILKEYIYFHFYWLTR